MVAGITWVPATVTTATTLTNSSITTDNVWRVWSDQCYQLTQQATWCSWTSTSVLTNSTTVFSQSAFDCDVWRVWAAAPRPPESTEARLLRREQDRISQLRFDESQRKIAEEARLSRARAEKLLVRQLSPAQKDTLSRLNYFDLDVGGKTYRIKRGTHGNVREIVNGIETASFCIQPPGLPTEDVMLAQKLLLEANEPEFLRIANRTVLRS